MIDSALSIDIITYL